MLAYMLIHVAYNCSSQVHELCPNLIRLLLLKFCLKFANIHRSNQIFPNLSKFNPQILLRVAAASPAPTALPTPSVVGYRYVLPMTVLRYRNVQPLA